MNRENVMREALSDLEAQRASNIETERQRREEARAKSAEIAALLDERQKLFYSGKGETDFQEHENGNGTPESKTARGARSKRLAGRLFAACVSLRNLQRYRICRGTDS